MTKTDLADPTDFLSHFEGVDDLTVFTSGTGDMPVDEIGRHLVGHSTVFVGHSGVGKSTLVNRLVPGASRATGEVSELTGKGRHTSTSALAMALPDGGWIIDTPGVRSFGISHVGVGSILGAFGDLSELAEDCPRGCRHDSAAPECALDDAVADGRLAPSRLASFRRMERAFT